MSEAVIATIGNLKGGVAKTSTSIALAIMASLLGKRVLLVDADLQGNATSALGYEPGQIEHTTYSVMMRKSSFQQAVLTTSFDKGSLSFLHTRERNDGQLVRGPDLLPSNLGAARADSELIHNPRWGDLLKNTLHSVRPLYDYIFIDTNPGLGKMTVNAFIGSDYVIIPTVPERWPTEGILILCSSIEEARMSNPDLQVAGLLFSRVRYAEHTRLMQYIQNMLLPKIALQYPDIAFTNFKMYINESAAFASATNKVSSVVLTNPTDPVSLSYWGFFAEFLQRISSADFPLTMRQYQKLLAVHKQQKEKTANPS